MTCIHGKNNCSICYTAGYLATPDVIVEQPSLPPLPLTVEQIQELLAIANATVEPHLRWKVHGRMAGDDEKLYVYSQATTPSYIAKLCEQTLSLQSECEALRKERAQIVAFVKDIHEQLKRGKDTADHGLMMNLKCILDHVVPDTEPQI